MTRHGCWLVASLLGMALPALCANDGSPVDLVVTVGKSIVLDTPADLRRVSVANGDLAEALAVNPREVLINGKAPGETSVILWQQDGARTMYDLTVRQNTARIEAVQGQLKRGLEGQDISLEFENETVFLRGTVKDLSSAERASSMGNQLSGGEQQMLAIGRALMTNPRLLILDEATEGLAPLTRSEIWRCLARLKSEGVSILVIDKNVAALTKAADRHFIIERGRVVWSGLSRELAASPDIQHRYLGV